MIMGFMSKRVGPSTLHDEMLSVVSGTQATGDTPAEVLEASSLLGMLRTSSFHHLADRLGNAVPARLAKLLTPTGHGGEDGKVLFP